MNRIDKQIKKNILAFFQKRKVLTIAELKTFSSLSQRTIGRRLKQWKTYRSYNHNGCYYVLPEIPEFDPDGIWKYKDIRFSKHGGLRSSIIGLVEQSSCGLSAKDLSQSLGCSVLDALSYFKENSELLREREGGIYIYFSSKPPVYTDQQQRRSELRQSQVKKHLPSNANAVIILVELIKNPSDTLDQLTRRVRRRGITISIDEVRNLLLCHGLNFFLVLALFEL